MMRLAGLLARQAALEHATRALKPTATQVRGALRDLLGRLDSGAAAATTDLWALALRDEPGLDLGKGGWEAWRWPTSDWVTPSERAFGVLACVDAPLAAAFGRAVPESTPESIDMGRIEVLDQAQHHCDLVSFGVLGPPLPDREVTARLYDAALFMLGASRADVADALGLCEAGLRRAIDPETTRGAGWRNRMAALRYVRARGIEWHRKGIAQARKRPEEAALVDEPA